MISFSYLFLALLLFPTLAWAGTPRLVLLVVVDQMRADSVERYAADFSSGGLNAFFQDGVSFSSAAYDYSMTKTAPS